METNSQTNLSGAQKQELTEVLHFIAGSDVRLSAHSANLIFKKYEKIHPMDYSDFLRRIEKLMRDGHLTKSYDANGQATYMMTVSGKDFDQHGGYSKRPEFQNQTLPVNKGYFIKREFIIAIIATLLACLILWYYYK